MPTSLRSPWPAAVVLAALAVASAPDARAQQAPAAPPRPPPAAQPAISPSAPPAPPAEVAPPPTPPPYAGQPAPIATVPQSAPPPTPVPAPSPREVMERRVHVDIDSTRPATVIERRVSVTEGDGAYLFVPFHSTQAIWEQVCVTPCRVDLDRYSSYRVAVLNRVAGSHAFTLPQSSDSVHMQVESGDLLANRAGRVLGAVGLAATIVGLGLIAGQHIFTDETGARNAGFITGGSGLLLMAVGIPLAIATATHVTFDGGGHSL